jgi:putative aldouronate transport system substrate-binding protein
MTKKIAAFLLTLVLACAMTACSTPSAPKPSDEAAPSAGSSAPADEPTGEIVTLRYYEIGNQDTNTREAVQDAINAYIEPLIGANVEFQIVGWGDWGSKALTALQAGEEIDIFFTADWQSYVRSVMQNLFMPLNDDDGEYGSLLELYGKDILDTLNPAFITGTQINGVNYAVPTNKELCVPSGFIYNVDAAQEVGMDPAAIQTLEDFEPYLAKYKELHPEYYGYLNDGSWGNDPWASGWVNDLNGNLIYMVSACFLFSSVSQTE